MKKRVRWLAAALAALLLAGCSLARPEARAGSGDRFIGVYVFRAGSGEDGFYNNPHRTEYGSDRVNLDGYGAFSVPRQVLFAEEDGDGGYTFPGMEGGYTLFAVKGISPDGSAYHSMVSNMGAGKEGNALHVTSEDAGQTTVHRLSGAVYYGPPAGAGPDWDGYDQDTIWTGYRVYQTEDGRIYLDGSGNSFGGGGGFSFSLSEEQTTASRGKSATERVEISVSVQAVPRLEQLSVTQFGADNTVLCASELPLAGETLPAVGWAAGAAWALVEEAGPEGVKRTAYSRPGLEEEPVSHQVVLLDSAGLGRMAQLTIGQ